MYSTNSVREELYKSSYKSPLGTIFLLASARRLCSMSFYRPYATSIQGRTALRSLYDKAIDGGTQPIIKEALEWLASYFRGVSLPVPTLYTECVRPLSPFTKAVYGVTSSIPYGSTLSYMEVALRVKELLGTSRAAPRAVGAALSRNPIALMIPCHRVITKARKAGGYAYGSTLKEALLKLEGVRLH